MLNAIYLYGLRVCSKNIPVLVESRSAFSNATSCSTGLLGLAGHLVDIVERNFSSDYRGPIKIIKHAPVLDMAYAFSDYYTYVLPEKQRQSFQRLLPKKMQIDWVDIRTDDEFKKNLAFWQDYFKKSNPAIVVRNN